MRARLQAAIAAIDGVVESESMFKADVAFWVNGKEIAHFESDRILDVRLTRSAIQQRRAELRADPRVRLRSSSSDWITVEVAGPDALDLVTDLVRRAAEIHQAPPGAIPDPPPAGADLAKRRRIH